jgi:hypothetical protein
MARALTSRERSVLVALLAVDFPGVKRLRDQAEEAEVVGECGCGCPSIDFRSEPGAGMRICVNAAIEGSPRDGLFLFLIGGRLGGIEYVGASSHSDPDEFPDPSALVVTLA